MRATRQLQLFLDSLPYHRWFCWLALCCLAAVVQPFFADRASTFYSPEIGTFLESGAPSPAHISIDGFTAAQLNARWFVWLGLVIVSLHFLLLAVRWTIAARRHARQTPVPGSHPNV